MDTSYTTNTSVDTSYTTDTRYTTSTATDRSVSTVIEYETSLTTTTDIAYTTETRRTTETDILSLTQTNFTTSIATASTLRTDFTTSTEISQIESVIPISQTFSDYVTISRTIDLPDVVSTRLTVETSTNSITNTLLQTLTVSDSIIAVLTSFETLTSLDLESSTILIPITTTQTAVESSVAVETVQETRTSIYHGSSTVLIPTTITQTAIVSSLTIKISQETRTSTEVFSTSLTQTELDTITTAQTLRETLTSIELETSSTILPVTSTAFRTSIVTLVRSGTTFTAESILTSYVTLLPPSPTAGASSVNQPAEPSLAPATGITSGPSLTLATTSQPTCHSYGPSVVPDAAACNGAACKVEYEVGYALKWQQYPEKPPVVTEMVFVSAGYASEYDIRGDFADISSHPFDRSIHLPEQRALPLLAIRLPSTNITRPQLAARFLPVQAIL